MRISIAGFPAKVDEDEIKAALAEHGVPVRSVTLEPDNDGKRTLAVVDVDTDETGARALAERLDGRIWRDHKLRARAHLFLK